LPPIWARGGEVLRASGGLKIQCIIYKNETASRAYTLLPFWNLSLLSTLNAKEK